MDFESGDGDDDDMEIKIALQAVVTASYTALWAWVFLERLNFIMTVISYIALVLCQEAS